jgi:hypothetical protein
MWSFAWLHIGGGRMSDENIGDWTMRVYAECANESGPFVTFWMWMNGNYPDIVNEWITYDAMMRGEE